MLTVTALKASPRRRWAEDGSSHGSFTTRPRMFHARCEPLCWNWTDRQTSERRPRDLRTRLSLVRNVVPPVKMDQLFSSMGEGVRGPSGNAHATFVRRLPRHPVMVAKQFGIGYRASSCSGSDTGYHIARERNMVHVALSHQPHRNSWCRGATASSADSDNHHR